MAFRLSPILRFRPQNLRYGFGLPEAPRKQKSTQPPESSKRPMSDGEILRDFHLHGPPVSELLLLTLQFDDETTERLNKIRASIVPPDKTMASLSTTCHVFSQMPVKHFDLYDKTLVDICSRTEPFSGGASFPKVQKMARQPVVRLDFQSHTFKSLYRSMISEWKGKVSMPQTLVSDYRLETHVSLHTHLSPLEAQTSIKKLTNEFPRGIGLGYALGFCLHTRSPRADSSYLTNVNPYIRNRRREILKIYKFKGVESIKLGKDLETYQNWLRWRSSRLDKDV